MDRDEDKAHIISTLDSKKKMTNEGVEYWMARELQGVLGYSTWENFSKVIDKATYACESSGIPIENHFRDATKVIVVGKGNDMTLQDSFLTRYACYLIAMNSDPRKPEIGFAQTYFAVQTRRQEIQDSLTTEERRIELRQKVKDANKSLNVAASRSGVQDYAIFTDQGYKGLYGGLGAKDIKRRKNISNEENLLDRAGRVELAANFFRITQAEEKLVRENIRGQAAANVTHFTVGRTVRNTISKLGGTMPEDLKPEPPIKRLLTRRKSNKKLLNS